MKTMHHIFQMRIMQLLIAIAVFIPAFPSERYIPTPEDLRASYQRAQEITRARSAVYKLQLSPNWFGEDRYFWYRNALSGGRSEFILVDCEKPEKKHAFDHQKLAIGLEKASSKTINAERLPFQSIKFSNDLKTIQFEWEGKIWECELENYECKIIGDIPPREDRQPPRRQARTPSPDKKWNAEIREGKIKITTTDGTLHLESEQNDFTSFSWAPSSNHLVAFRVLPGDRKQVYLIESSPQNGGRAVLTQRDYDLPGDKLDTYETYIFDITNKKQTKSDIEPFFTGGRPWAGPPSAHWLRDGKTFVLSITERGYQRYTLLAINTETNEIKTLVEEKFDTFVDTTSLMYHYLNNSDELIWRSERDGWGRLYLIDTKTGSIKNAITPERWVVRGIENVDEQNRRIVFRANHTRENEDPYFIHFFAVDLDGKKLTRLTEAHATHSANFSPSYKYFVNTYSRVDEPQTHELRSTADGKLLLHLESADITEWKRFNIPFPEPFIAKGRDGETDIYGIICRPSNLDTNKKYPIIENIYAGPQDSFVPKSFSALLRMQELAELGFIVVQIDGMGTRNRGKKFHDVCWQNIADAGFPDRILWIKAMAQKYPYADIERVGVYGTSAGGQNAAGALLFHPDFYKVGVASCGCHDNRMDKFWWNEQWMGYPVGKHYEEQSNITNAHKLQGKLLLIVGEMDTNVPPESTLRLVDALIKAGKDFDFLFMPGVGHSDGGNYGERKRRDFFVRNLHGVEPPNRNSNQD